MILHTSRSAFSAFTIRERVWSRLAQASPDPHGRIPDFVGAAAAAVRLTELLAWSRARVIKANPDQPQLPVRERALREGKLVYMAVPKLADPLPFFRLDPAELGDGAEVLAAHRAAASRAPKTAVTDMQPVDLIVSGAVVVNRQGVRIGKGAGYSDIEVRPARRGRAHKAHDDHRHDCASVRVPCKGA